MIKLSLGKSREIYRRKSSFISMQIIGEECLHSPYRLQIYLCKSSFRQLCKSYHDFSIRSNIAKCWKPAWLGESNPLRKWLLIWKVTRSICECVDTELLWTFILYYITTAFRLCTGKLGWLNLLGWLFLRGSLLSVTCAQLVIFLRNADHTITWTNTKQIDFYNVGLSRNVTFRTFSDMARDFNLCIHKSNKTRETSWGNLTLKT